MDSSSVRSDSRPMNAEEEAIKLNTDCVYFLASPLTCKKGSECEYRHSEGARLNPRDCRFWLSGNCLNPKCLFRHPPLDGMVASPKTTSGQIVASAHLSPSVQLPMANSYNFGKNNVPCYYYLKGACLKGDKCPFMHGPLSVGYSVAKQNPKVFAQIAMQSETPEKDAGKIKERNNQQNLSTLNIANVSADKLVNGSLSSGKGGKALEKSPGSRNGVARSQATYDPVRSSSSYSSSQNLHVQHDTDDRHLLHWREAGEVFEKSSGVGHTELERPLNHQLQSPSDQYQNAQDAEEVFRDSSPGFDVLVDHVVWDADYFHEKDGFRSGASQGRKNANFGDDYDHYLSDYESSSRLDRFRHNGAGQFQQYGNEQNGDDWNKHVTSERIFDRSLLTERSSARRLRIPDEMDASDLRHRLRKQRRKDGYFSATSSVRYSEPYSKHDKNMKDGYHAHNSYKDQHLHGTTIGSRLGGRITLPKPHSPEIPSDLQDEGDRGRKRVRMSPVRLSGNHRSLQQRLSWKPIEESFANPRYFVRQHKTRDDVDLLDFAGPRSLDELKGAKADINSQGQSTKYNHSTSSLEHNRLGSLKTSRLRDSEASVEFEGPKPLSVLLKRKREAGSESDAISGVSNNVIAVVESEAGYRVFARDNLEDTKTVSNFEEPKVGTVEESLIPTEDEQINYEQQAAGDETEAKDAIEDEEEPDYADQNDGDYNYDTVGGGDYKTEGDYMDNMDEDLDADEDEDDFAKKIGLIFS